MPLPPRPRHDIPVFFDPGQRRWTLVKSGAAILAALLTIFLGILLISVLIDPTLPGLRKLNLNNAQDDTGESTPVPASYGRTHALNDIKNELFDENFKSRYLGRLQKKRRPRAEGQPLSLGFLVNWDTNSFQSLRRHAAQLDGFIATWLHWTPGNPAKEDVDSLRSAVLDWRAKQELPLKAFVQIDNYDGQGWQGEKLGEALADPTQRRTLLQRLYEYVRAQNAQGICLDFEDIPDRRMPVFQTFVQEIYIHLHREKIAVLLNLPLRNDSVPYARLAPFCDYIILSAYEQHWANSTPGPLASTRWFENALNRRVAEISPAKVIVALATYGFDWPQPDSAGAVAPTTRSLTWDETLKLAAERQVAITYDEKSGNPFFTYREPGDAVREVWMLDAITAFNQAQTVKKLKTAGLVFWRLGSEDPAVWNYWGLSTTPDTGFAAKFETLPAPEATEADLDAELIGLTTPPHAGKRSVTFDAASGLITHAEYTEIPARGSGIKLKAPGKKIVLTFDDGPDPAWTPAILDVLQQKQAHAAFFSVGYRGDEHPELLERIVDEGHELGSHTYTHPNIARISERQLELELNATQRLFESVTGRRSILFRPPYGANDVARESHQDFQPLQRVAEMGYLTIGMKIDPRDYELPEPIEIVERCVQLAEKGEGHVILLHDGGGDRSHTLAALPLLIDRLREKGFEITTIAGLMDVPPAQLMPPISNVQKAPAFLNRGAFILLSGFKKALTFIFIAGTVLGVLRLLMIGVLAIYERRRALKKIFDPAYKPRVAVIVPGYNEEKVILQTIASLLACEGPEFEIIVVDDGSTDRTFFVVMEAYPDHPRIKYFKKPNGGKSAALNFGISQTEAEIIVAMDADTVFARNTIANLVRHFSDPFVGAVAGNAKVGNRINILTRWQALEYITSQNLDRRAFSVLNCITVVPGAVGAWRRELVLKAGGFTGETLAEDADLTMSIRRMGMRIVNEEGAIALTEAPDTFKGFIKQRYRWMFGTLQAAWKHKRALFNPKYGALGFIALPNILIFQVLFPLLSPVMDLLLFFALGKACMNGWAAAFADPASPIPGILFYYLLFVATDFGAALLAFVLEPAEDWTLLFWLYWQRFCYRQIMYYVAIRSTVAMLRGMEVGWGKLERKATVKAQDVK